VDKSIEQMGQDLAFGEYSKSTRSSYLRTVKKLAAHSGRTVVTAGLAGYHFQRHRRYPGTRPLARRRFFALPAAARGRAWSKRSQTAALRSARASPVRAASRSGARVAEAFLKDEVL
jgi:hypothetical protein